MCVCVPTPKAINISNEVWHDMDPVGLRSSTTFVLQLYSVSLVGMTLQLNCIVKSNLGSAV